MEFGIEPAAQAAARCNRVLILAASGFEDSELLVPYYRLLEEGFEVDIASVRRGSITGEHGYRARANLSLREAEPERYAALVVPGGKAPQALRLQPDALGLVHRFNHASKPIGAICHGLLLLAAAGVLEGRNATAQPSLAAELALAGAIYDDRDVVVDHNIVTSRRPADLPAFMRALLTQVNNSRKLRPILA